MKKVFIQIRQWILRHRKRIIYGALALFVFQICFFDLGGIGIENNVFAEETTSKNDFQTKIEEWNEGLSFFKVVLYVLVYPILIVAGKLVDNSMVYGEIFGFDSILWNLRVVVRNISNYCLGGLFMFYIFKYLITGQKGDDIKKLLISTLIAGVGIQASWFIMSVLIDTSTILTYSLGGLPTTVLADPESLKDTGESGELRTKDPYILKTTLIYDVDSDPNKIQVYMSTGSQQYIAECETFDIYNDGEQETLILAPKYLYYNGGIQGTKVISTMCNYENNVYFFSSLYNPIADRRIGECSGDECKENQDAYEEILINTKGTLTGGNKDEVKNAIEAGQILQIGDAHSVGGITGNVFKGIHYDTGNQRGLDVNNERNGTGGNAKLMSKLIDGTYAGVFSNLYVSLLNMGKNFKVSKGNSSSPFVQVLNEGLSFLFLLVITVPLLAVTIVFIMRIFIIWIAIAISPIIVLLAAFDLFKNDTVGSIKFLENFKISNLLPIIFSPAIVCFAISLCSVLVEIIKNINNDIIETEELSILSGVIKLDIASFGVAVGKITCSIICLATTRFLLRACIKATKLGDSKIITGLKDLTRSAVGSLPIVPIPTKEGTKAVGIDAAFGLNGKQSVADSLSQSLKSTFSKEDDLAIEDLFGNKKGNEAENETGKSYDVLVQELKQKIPAQGSRTEVEIDSGGGNAKFSEYTPEVQKEVIAEINKLSDDEKDKFGQSSPRVTLKDGTTYTYTANKKYEPSNPPQGNGGGNGAPSGSQ